MAEESTDVQEVLEYLRSIEGVMDVVLVSDPNNNDSQIPRLTVRKGDARGTSYRRMVENILCADVCSKQIPQGMEVLILEEGSPAEEAELHIALDPVEQGKRAVERVRAHFQYREVGVFPSDTEAIGRELLEEHTSNGLTVEEPSVEELSEWILNTHPEALGRP